MSTSLKYVIDQFNLQTKLFNNSTITISDTNSQSKLSETTNHAAWLTGHTVSSRFMLANILGLQVQEQGKRI